MKRIMSPEELRAKYIRGVEQGVSKYRENAIQSSEAWMKRFMPFYEAQIQASLETADLSGPDRLVAYAERVAQYMKRAKTKVVAEEKSIVVVH